MKLQKVYIMNFMSFINTEPSRTFAAFKSTTDEVGEIVYTELTVAPQVPKRLMENAAREPARLRAPNIDGNTVTGCRT